MLDVFHTVQATRLQSCFTISTYDISLPSQNSGYVPDGCGCEQVQQATHTSLHMTYFVKEVTSYLDQVSF